MNITDLIVELLQQGQKVDLPGIGTLDTVLQSPHHDPATRTYYPATRTIVFHAGEVADGEMAKVVAQRECVSDEVGHQMWINYVDALTDKVKRTGDHQFGNLGTLNYNNGAYSFTVAEGLVINADNVSETPLTNVKTYEHNNQNDPFAQFEEDEPKMTVVGKIKEEPKQKAVPEVAPAPEPEPEPEPVPEPEPEPVPEPEPAPEPASAKEDQWQESLRKLDELPKSKAALKAEAKAEKERLKAEAKAEKERQKLEKLAEKDHEDKLKNIALQEENAAQQEAESRRLAEEEIRKAEIRAEEERRRSEKTENAMLQKAEEKAEEERIKAEKRAAALAAVAAAKGAQGTHAAAETTSAPISGTIDRAKMDKYETKQRAAELAAAEKLATRLMKEERKAAKKAEKKAAKQYGEKSEKKSRKGLWVVLLILLILILGGAAAYYFLVMNRMAAPAATTTEKPTGKHLDVPAVRPLTFNTDLIIFNGREIARNRDLVCLTMSDYINNYLIKSGYGSARVPMMDRVSQYAEERLNSLLGDRFAVQRFIPYDDYIYNASQPWLKGVCADKARAIVQGELMNETALEEMLKTLVEELGIEGGQPAPAAAEGQQERTQEATAAATAPAKNVKKKKAEGNPVYVYVEKESKQGFDIVAGFYLNKNTAAQMTARLHEQGCDAYIIEKNDMFYVSMGSAPTRTKAEALYNHIKSWYDGDIVIKEL